MGELGARAANDQRAASTPTSASSSSRVMNSPARLLMDTSWPSRTKRTQATRSIWTASMSKPMAFAALRTRATVPWWSAPQM